MMRKIIRLLPDAFKNFFEVEVSINKTLVLSFILIISQFGKLFRHLVRKYNCRFNKLTIYNFQELQSEN